MTVTLTVPDPAGAVAVILVAEMTRSLVARLPPKRTARTPMKSRPRIVTLFPPRARPAAGDSEAIFGPATNR